MRENDLKIELLKYLLKKKVNWSFLASEVPFLGLSRFIDICAGTLKSTYAFEIKGDYDRLSRLDGQLKDMLLSFDFVFVVTTEKHIRNVLKKVPKKVGVLLWDAKKIKLVKKPICNKKLNPISLLSFVSKNEILKHYRPLISNTNASAFEIRREVARKLNINELIKLKRNFLKNKYQRRTTVFLKEIGSRITTDDLEILSSDYPTDLKIV